MRQKTRRKKKKSSIKFGRFHSLLVVVIAIFISGPVLFSQNVRIFQTVNKVSAQSSTGLSITPASQSVIAGQPVSVAITLLNNSNPVNTVQATISYPANLLTETGIDYGSSFEIKAQETLGNGTITIVRGTTTPKTGTTVVATVHFQASATGQAVIALSNAQADSSITNTNILASLTNAVITIVSPAQSPTLSPSPSLTPQVSWTGQYFQYSARDKNRGLNGTPVLVRTDPQINFHWGTGSPAPAIKSDYFSARWSATPTFLAGIYKFKTVSDDGIRVYIDKKLQSGISSWSNHAAKTLIKNIPLSAGIHTIVVEYYQNLGQAVAQFSYTKVK